MPRAQAIHPFRATNAARRLGGSLSYEISPRTQAGALDQLAVLAVGRAQPATCRPAWTSRRAFGSRPAPGPEEG